VELLEGGAGSLEVGEFHLRIFTGEDDAIGTAMEGGKDGIADAVGRALAVWARWGCRVDAVRHRTTRCYKGR